MAKKAVRKSRKEIEEEKRARWLKYGLVLLVAVIMITVTLSYLINPAQIRNRDTTETTTFGSIVSAVSMLPKSAEYIRYVDLGYNSSLSNAAALNFGPNLPNSTLLGASAVKDALASFPFPQLGYYAEDPQVVVLSDLGTGFDNASYPETTVNSVPVRIVKDPYAFSVGTYPVISGRADYVSSIVRFWSAATTANSAYATYADLFDQINETNLSASKAKLAVVGLSDTLGIGDRYYAGITPFNETMYDYRIVIHLNQTLNDTQQQNFTQRWVLGASLYGLEPQTPQFKDDYLLLAARGNVNDCLSDMSEWEFLKG